MTHTDPDQTDAASRPDAAANTAHTPKIPSSPIAELLLIAVPAIVTMTSYTLMQFADMWIVSSFPDAVAAVGNAGVGAFVPGAAMMGLISIVNTFVSQNLGAGRPERGAAYAWNGLWLTCVLWVLMLVPFAIFLPEVFQGMRTVLGLEDVSENLKAMEIVYGRIIVLGMVFTIGARNMSHYFYGMHKPAIVMISAITANLVNVVITWNLVQAAAHPATGEPDAIAGVTGAAIGTVIGSGVELLIPIALFLSPRYNTPYRTRAAWKPSLHHIKELLKLGWSPALMMGNELICWWIFMAGFIATFDHGEHTIHNTAGWIVLRYMHLSFMPAVGCSIALAAIVGRYVGKNDIPTAIKRIWLGLLLTIAYMALWAIAFVVFREQLVGVFLPTDGPGAVPLEIRTEIIKVGAFILIIAAAFQMFDAVAIALSGALRGAGDTVFQGIVTIVLSWGLIVGGGWLMVHYWPEFGSAGPWAAAAAYIIALSIALFWRFMGNAWKTKSVIREKEAEALGLSCKHCGYDLASHDPATPCPQCSGSPA